VAAQDLLPEINSDKVSFVGAWTLYGFHEDGFTSGICAAEQLGAKIPFDIVDARYIRGKQKRGMISKRNRWDDFGRMVLELIPWLIMAFVGVLHNSRKLE
jgi:hypothetical protein